MRDERPVDRPEGAEGAEEMVLLRAEEQLVEIEQADEGDLVAAGREREAATATDRPR